MNAMKKLILSAVVATAIVLFGFATIFLIKWTGIGVPNERLLVNAAANDDLATFTRIAAKGISLDAQERGMLGHTPLIATTFIKGTNVFYYLLASGAKVDARDRDDETALMTAVMLGDSNLLKIKALIEAGADVNARDRHGSSVLRRAKWAAVGRLPGFSVTSTLQLLEQHGAKE
jgi:hypothetical protein